MSARIVYNLLLKSATFLTTLVAGYLVAHVIVLGRYFDWLVANGHAAQIEATYSVFRAAHDPVTPYVGSFVLQFLVVSALLAVAIVMWRRHQIESARLIGPTLGVLAAPLVIIVFEISGFHDVEEAVMSGANLSQPILEAWTRQNFPLHLFTAAAYLLPSIFLCKADGLPSTRAVKAN